VILSGLLALGVAQVEIRGKTILLKPNLIEIEAGALHTHAQPPIIRGGAEAFLRTGGPQVSVGEGTAPHRDSLRLLEESSWRDILVEDRIAFVDL